jgi:hypothetical protein
MPFPLVGPQARLKFNSTPATRFRPAAAELNAEVGQMLVYVRIKQQASMTAFTKQLTQITDALAPAGPAPPTAAAAAAAAAAQQQQRAASPTPYLPKLQTALKVGQMRIISLAASPANDLLLVSNPRHFTPGTHRCLAPSAHPPSLPCLACRAFCFLLSLCR